MGSKSRQALKKSASLGKTSAEVCFAINASSCMSKASEPKTVVFFFLSPLGFSATTTQPRRATMFCRILPSWMALKSGLRPSIRRS